MTTALIAVALIAVGLPLAAWWLGGRSFWSRLRRRPASDPWLDVLRRHRLTGAEAGRVISAVERGERLDDPRLRRAAVELAEQSLELSFPPWAGATRLQRVMVVVTVAWAALLVAHTVFALVLGDAGDVNWFPVLALVVAGGLRIRQGQRLHRAVRLNGEQPPTEA